FKQEPFDGRPAPRGVAAERPLRGQHAVAGDDNGDPVAATSTADGSGCGAEFFRDLAVTQRLAVRDLAKSPPDSLLELRAIGGQRQIKLSYAPGKVSAQLIRRLAQQRSAGIGGVGLALMPDKIQRRDHSIACRNDNYAERRFDREFHSTLPKFPDSISIVPKGRP